MPLVVNIGDSTKDNPFPPPAAPGVYKVKLGMPREKPMEKYEGVTRLSIQAQVQSDVNGTKAAGWANFSVMIIPAGREGEFEKINPDMQIRKTRNLLASLGAASRLAGAEEGGQRTMEVNPERWEGRVLWARISIQENNQTGQPQGEIQSFLSDEQIAKETGATEHHATDTSAEPEQLTKATTKAEPAKAKAADAAKAKAAEAAAAAKAKAAKAKTPEPEEVHDDEGGAVDEDVPTEPPPPAAAKSRQKARQEQMDDTSI